MRSEESEDTTKKAREMNASEIADALSVILVYREGWPLQAKLVADRAAANSARKLIECAQGDPELSKPLKEVL